MSQITVQFGALDMGVDALASAHRTLLSQINDLEAAMQPLLAVWDGTARQAYQQCQADWRRAADDIGRVLAQLKDAVNNSNATMQARERSNTALFGG